MPRTGRASRDTPDTRATPCARRSERNSSVVRTSPYTPIDSENGEIRLLELAPGKFNDTIVMQLVPCNIIADNPIAYEALSYCWGTELATQTAMLDGIPISITANLDSALRHLRLPFVKRTMWVDAISINQAATQERNHQVQIMGKIYSTAQRVMVWLGPTDKDDLYSRVVLGAMQFHFKELNPSTVRLFDYMCSVVDIINAQAGKVRESAECVLDALHSVIDRPWFSRIWVVQELALAKVALVAIGSYSFRWHPFESFFKWLPAHKLNLETRPQLAEKALRVTRASAYKPFPSQFLRTMHLSASDPRDKIFGILGISKFSGPCIVPDYTKSTGEVILDAAVAMLREGTLAIYYLMPLQPVRAGENLEGVSGLPSWVPDLLSARALFATYGQGKPLISPPEPITCHLPDAVLSMQLFLPFVPTFYGMCKVVPFRPVAFSPDFRQLLAPGILIGTIVDTSGDLLDHLKISTLGTDLPQVLRQVYQSVIEPRGIAVESMIRLLCSGFAPEFPQAEKPDYQAVMNSFSTDVQQVHLSKTARHVAKDLVAIIERNAADRVVFVTNDNKIGLVYHPDAAHGVQSGDVIAGLFGVNFPFILRPTGDGHYRMINVARVYGLRWGHEFLGNQLSHTLQAHFDEPQVKDIQRKFRKKGREVVSDITWRDYKHHGMQEFVIV